MNTSWIDPEQYRPGSGAPVVLNVSSGERRFDFIDYLSNNFVQIRLSEMRVIWLAEQQHVVDHFRYFTLVSVHDCPASFDRLEIIGFQPRFNQMRTSVDSLQNILQVMRKRSCRLPNRDQPLLFKAFLKILFIFDCKPNSADACFRSSPCSGFTICGSLCSQRTRCCFWWNRTAQRTQF